jgi:transcriptional regulator with XRE-family HTH domain
VSLGERIGALRRAIPDLTQERLAELCKLSESGIQKIEAGQRWPRDDTLEKIAEILGVPVMKLFCDFGQLSDDEINELAIKALTAKKNTTMDKNT